MRYPLSNRSPITADIVDNAIAETIKKKWPFKRADVVDELMNKAGTGPLPTLEIVDERLRHAEDRGTLTVSCARADRSALPAPTYSVAEFMPVSAPVITRDETRDRYDRAVADFVEQQRWVEDHGSDLDGYVARYGTPRAPDFERWPDGFYGNGGEAIYSADLAELERLRKVAMTLGQDPLFGAGAPTDEELADAAGYTKATPSSRALTTAERETLAATVFGTDPETIGDALGALYAARSESLAGNARRLLDRIVAASCDEAETSHGELLRLADEVVHVVDMIRDAVRAHAKVRGVTS